MVLKKGQSGTSLYNRAEYNQSTDSSQATGADAGRDQPAKCIKKQDVSIVSERG